MNYEKRINQFFNFELTLSQKELSYWDVFRYDLFCYIVYENRCKAGEKTSIGIKKLYSIPKIVVGVFIEFFFTIVFLIFKRHRRLFFTCSRYRIGGKFIDVNARDILGVYGRDSVCVDTWNKTFYLEEIYYRFKKKYKKIVAESVSNELVEKINSTFQVTIDRSFYEIRVAKYLAKKDFYRFIFKLLCPHSIFFIQNGVRKEWIMAAKELHIPSIEIQHGEVGPTHPAYHYPKNFNKNSVVAADFLFVWSDFWKNRINFPGVNIVTTGNSYYFVNKENNKTKKYDVTIISNSEHTPIFNRFIMELLENGYEGKVCYKLHPQQVSEFESIKKCWQEFSNIEVILFEKNAIDVINESKNILAIHSTVVFQALDMNCKVLLYTVIDEYLSHKDIFDHPNVYKVNCASDFLEKIAISVKPCSVKYYEDFDVVRCQKIFKTFNL